MHSPFVLFFVMIATVLAANFAQAETVQISVNGQPRNYILERPSVAGPRPTIIMLHGAGRQGVDIALDTGLGQSAPRAGWVAVFPNGRAGRWNFFPPGKETAKDLEFFKQNGGLPDDVGFIRQIVGDLIRRSIADPKRVYISGLSLGGVMALRMACTDAGTFAAAGLLISAMSEVTGAECRPNKPLPVLSFNGTADTALPYVGGLSQRGDPLWSARRLNDFFRQLNGCTGAPEQTVFTETHPHKIEIEHWTRCPGGTVVHYRLVGGGHQIPSSIDPGKLLMNFFQSTSR